MTCSGRITAVRRSIPTFARAKCPNVGKFLKNLKFTLQMENEIMKKILDDGEEPEAAGSAWLKANPTAVDAWLAGVTTKDGGDAKAAVKGSLGL